MRSSPRASGPGNHHAQTVRVAVLLPALNEAGTIAKVVRDFYAALPRSKIYVYDNGSADDTGRLAAEAGAIVRHEPGPGKGNVVRRMFAEVEADVYVISDSDDTYDPSAAPDMVRLLIAEDLDMVVGTRSEETAAAFRRGHRLGNRLFSWTLARLFESPFTDILSGYRVFSRRFVKSFPLLSHGFEIEVMLTVHALELGIPAREVPTPYRERMEGAPSKLRTVRDGFRILAAVLLLFKESRPFQLFGLSTLLLTAIALGFGIPLVVEFLETGLVPRFPSAILAAALAVLGAISLTVGLTLDTVSRGRREQRRLAYLAHASVRSGLGLEEATRNELDALL